MKQYAFMPLIILIFLSASLYTLSADYFIIANENVPENKIDRQRLRDIFLGNTGNWDNGGRIILATLRRGKARDSFLSDIIGRTSAQFDRYWKEKAFTGKGIAPKILENDECMIDFIASNDGAIGYTDTMPEEDSKVKIIKID